jgi:hypothetical protein
MTQLPGWLNVTVAPETEHTALLPETMLKLTGWPDPPPDAATR